MIAIVDYKAGNLASVGNALGRLDAAFRITNRPDELERADGVIFPGVGHAVPAMHELRAGGVDCWLQQTQKPVLGICLGMQLMFSETTEGPTRTLGILPGTLRKFDRQREKVPHMGWNIVSPKRANPLLRNIPPETHFYHVHSYYAPVTDDTVAVAVYSVPFTAVAARKNYFGVQFHPEKSGAAGQLLLGNFLDLVYGRQPSQPDVCKPG